MANWVYHISRKIKQFARQTGPTPFATNTLPRSYPSRASRSCCWRPTTNASGPWTQLKKFLAPSAIGSASHWAIFFINDLPWLVDLVIFCLRAMRTVLGRCGMVDTSSLYPWSHSFANFFSSFSARISALLCRFWYCLWDFSWSFLAFSFWDFAFFLKGQRSVIWNRM